jgi:hypothetical protein
VRFALTPIPYGGKPAYRAGLTILKTLRVGTAHNVKIRVFANGKQCPPYKNCKKTTDPRCERPTRGKSKVKSQKSKVLSLLATNETSTFLLAL